MKDKNEKWVQTGIFGDKPAEPRPPVILRRQLAQYIRTCGTTRAGFAALIGVSPATITKWLTTDTVPSLPILQKFARRTGLELGEVLDFFKE